MMFASSVYHWVPPKQEDDVSILWQWIFILLNQRLVYILKNNIMKLMNE